MLGVDTIVSCAKVTHMFTTTNQPLACRGCGKQTTRGNGGVGGSELCGRCQEDAALENAHSDGLHEKAIAGCSLCAEGAPAVTAPPTLREFLDEKRRQDGLRALNVRTEPPFTWRYRVTLETHGGYYGWEAHSIKSPDVESAERMLLCAARSHKMKCVDIYDCELDRYVKTVKAKRTGARS